jgi:hypothetical protein
MHDNDAAKRVGSLPKWARDYIGQIKKQMTTILDYILYLESISSYDWKPPWRMEADDAWAEHACRWHRLHTAQKLLIIVLLGDQAERDRIKLYTEARPGAVTWQQLVNACFEPAMQVAPTAALARRNKRNERSIERSIP